MTAWEDFKSKSTEELIGAFQAKGGPKTAKDNAFFALVHRFRQDLLNACEVVCTRFGHSPYVAEIIAESTFKAYATKGNFDPKKGKGKTIDDSFRIYLYSIARNELTNYYRLEERKRKGQFYDGTEKIITALPQIDLESLDTAARVRYEIIQSLTDSQRTVYLTYQAYERIGCNLPKKLRLELRQYLGGVTQGTVRTYKKEATDKISAALKVMNITLNSK